VAPYHQGGLPQWLEDTSGHLQKKQVIHVYIIEGYDEGAPCDTLGFSTGTDYTGEVHNEGVCMFYIVKGTDEPSRMALMEEAFPDHSIRFIENRMSEKDEEGNPRIDGLAIFSRENMLVSVYEGRLK